MKTMTAYIGDVPVGDLFPTVFMAETGTFYNQDIDKAIFLIDQAADAGADIIKTEILHDPDIVLESAGLMHTYTHARGETKENYRKLIERKTVSLDNYQKIIRYVKQVRKIPFVASCYDFEGVDFMAVNKGDAIKLWKNNFTNPALIRYAAKTGLTLIFDAADVYLDEVAKCVRLALKNNAGGVIVNHHPGRNPAPPEIHNLKLIKRYKEVIKVPVGLSCHYRGEEILYAAVGAGVNLIEKGVYDNPDEDDQNVVSAASATGLESMIRKVRNCWLALGRPDPTVSEPRDTYTLQYGLTSKIQIAQGECFSLGNVKFAFPAVGIPVEHWDLIDGKKATRAIDAKCPICWGDVHLGHD